MNALQKSFDNSRAFALTVHNDAMRLKDAGALSIVPSGSLGQLSDFRSERADRERYGLFRGWLYSAINALAMKAASQPVNVARLLGAEPRDDERSRPSTTKYWHQRKMTQGIITKTAREEFELLLSHPLIDLLDRPNPIQSRWQFVYSFVANLNLTGWSFIVFDETEEGNPEMYSLPTTWVKVDHTDGPFSGFRIVNPKNPTASQDAPPLTRENVAFAYLPNPADPLAALPPVQTQSNAVRIDDHIQTSQERFFENGIFPSVVVTVGKNPTGTSGEGFRPRLSGAQKRQLKGAIQKEMGSVHNYGMPAIIDGMIESITRLSATQNEMGWEKSEEKVKTRILSAFSVHPFILGEPMNVGGYSQATVIKEVFCDRVNTFLDMLSVITTNRIAPKVSDSDRLVVWWEKCEPVDPQLRSLNLRQARNNGDISKNEIRAELGFSPIEEDEGARGKLLDTVGGMTGAVQIFNAMGQGVLPRESAALLLTIFFQIPIEQANQITGVGMASVPQAIDTLQTAIGELKKPVSIDFNSAKFDKMIADSIQSSPVVDLGNSHSDGELNEVRSMVE